jgi:hypothetical protein
MKEVKIEMQICSGRKDMTAGELLAFGEGFTEASSVFLSILKDLALIIDKNKEELGEKTATFGMSLLSDLVQNIIKVVDSVHANVEQNIATVSKFENLEKKEETIRH